MSHTPIRVLQVVTNMSYGGLENLLMNYYRHIDRNRVQFDFLTHVEIHQDFEEEIASLGGKLYRLPKLNPFSRSYRSALHVFLVAHPEYRIVHSHLDCTAGIPLQAAQKQGVPLRIAHAHSSSQNHNLKYLIKLYCRRSIPKYATHLFACGEKAGDWMFRGAPYTVMRNAIAVSDFTYRKELAVEVKAELGVSGSFVIGHVGQFRREKNHCFLIRIFHQILQTAPNCVLLLVGKGPEMAPAKALAQELGIEKQILFLGARGDIPQLMQAMDVFVLPSIYEGLPVTMVEAQAAGLPCFISDRVPIECKITEDVHQLSLEAPLSRWAEEILSYRDHQRKDTSTLLREAGFDITTNAKWLEEFYCNGAKD